MSANTEKIYDEQIAPLMAQIIAICMEHEIPLIAEAELYDADGELVYPRTSVFAQSAAMKMLHYLMLSGNNLDLFIITCMKDKRLTTGNSSAIMHILENRASEAGRPKDADR